MVLIASKMGEREGELGFNGDGRWMVGENDRRAWIEGGREVCNSAPACRMLIFSFFCLTRIDPMMKREALAGDADSRSGCCN